jgi:hypothetical protein
MSRGAAHCAAFRPAIGFALIVRVLPIATRDNAMGR